MDVCPICEYTASSTCAFNYRTWTLRANYYSSLRLIAPLPELYVIFGGLYRQSNGHWCLYLSVSRCLSFSVYVSVSLSVSLSLSLSLVSRSHSRCISHFSYNFFMTLFVCFSKHNTVMPCVCPRVCVLVCGCMCLLRLSQKRLFNLPEPSIKPSNQNWVSDTLD